MNRPPSYNHRDMVPAIFQTVGVAIFATYIVSTAAGQSSRGSDRPLRRASRPDWSQIDTSDIFFADAMRDGLRGARPARYGIVPPAVSLPTNGPTSPPAQDGQAFAWSRHVSAATLEDLVKSQRIALQQVIVQPAAFAAGGNQQARDHLVLLATLFAMIEEFDGRVRWQADAANARQSCQQAAAQARSGSMASFSATREICDKLADLLRGESLPHAERTTSDEGRWRLDRSVLMRDLDATLTNVIQPITARQEAFGAQVDSLRRGAEWTAALAEVLTQEAMNDAGDADYDAFCLQLQVAADALQRAIDASSISEAQAAAGEIKQSCTACHANYR